MLLLQLIAIFLGFIVAVTAFHFLIVVPFRVTKWAWGKVPNILPRSAKKMINKKTKQVKDDLITKASDIQRKFVKGKKSSDHDSDVEKDNLLTRDKIESIPNRHYFVIMVNKETDILKVIVEVELDIDDMERAIKSTKAWKQTVQKCVAPAIATILESNMNSKEYVNIGLQEKYRFVERLEVEGIMESFGVAIEEIYIKRVSPIERFEWMSSYQGEDDESDQDN